MIASSVAQSVSAPSGALSAPGLQGGNNVPGEHTRDLTPETIAGIVVLSVIFIFAVVALCLVGRRRQLEDPESIPPLPFPASTTRTSPGMTSPLTLVPCRRSMMTFGANPTPEGHLSQVYSQPYEASSTPSGQFCGATHPGK
ncbi:hypothetical protein NLI96_g4991 [Meripilus lineatus]|uniref:Uncharacterized protein n=1 Tax=Meripilus lineatus TaxID=2056292 RepID=A0AAD5YJJ6_9APHY|nr:hypothetical protein NLI96_g4991 [Physisporinus lineatus]